MGREGPRGATPGLALADCSFTLTEIYIAAEPVMYEHETMRLLLMFVFSTLSMHATTYYLAPASAGGSDSNSGTDAAHPWLSPNHAVNCGDVIVAAAGTTYNANNFSTGNWATVSCAGANNVAWLQCETFGACQITTNNTFGIWVDNNYWGVQGWEVSTTGGGYSACFYASPNYNRPAQIHHIVFANNVANGCQASGIATANANGSTTASVDYVAIIGNIIYHAAQASTLCFSGISIYQPILTDTAPGTHIYIAGNFTFDNFTGATACGTWPTDGNGIILDSIDFAQGGGTPYCGEIVVENNIAVFNGGRGILAGGSGNSCAPMLYRNNTMYGNSADNRQGGSDCGDMVYGWNQYNMTGVYNIAQSTAVTGCDGQASYAWIVDGGNTTDIALRNIIFGVNGQNTNIVNNSGGFSFGRNAYVDPRFANPVDPGQPNCSGKSSVTDCMSAVIANFKPRATRAGGFGYQPASAVPTTNPFFPQWLCNVNLPSGLISTPCAAPAADRSAGGQ
jgi:hypothetical protein